MNAIDTAKQIVAEMEVDRLKRFDVRKEFSILSVQNHFVYVDNLDLVKVDSEFAIEVIAETLADHKANYQQRGFELAISDYCSRYFDEDESYIMTCFKCKNDFFAKDEHVALCPSCLVSQ